MSDGYDLDGFDVTGHFRKKSNEPGVGFWIFITIVCLGLIGSCNADKKAKGELTQAPANGSPSRALLHR